MPIQFFKKSKRWASFFFVAFLAFAATAVQAEKARSICTQEDAKYHAQHLQKHVGQSNCYATGNYIKVLSEADKTKILGHLERADTFQLMDIQEGRALIQVIGAHQTSPDSWNGMKGWVHADYIDCTCSDSEYTAPDASDIRQCIGKTCVTCIANNLRIRNEPSGDVILGHLEKADRFLLLDVQDGWAKICITKAADTSADSWNGLTGWVSADYLRVDQYASPAYDMSYSEEWSGYGGVLDFFYRAIREKRDEQIISDAGFVPPEFPGSLEHCGFVFMDINEDGVTELFIVEEDEERYDAVFAGYTLVNGYPVRLFTGWARNRYYLCKDGSIYNTGSDGASYSIHYLYKLEGAELKIQEGVFSGEYGEDAKTQISWCYTTERSAYDFERGVLISEEQAWQKIEQYESMIDTSMDGFVTFAQYAQMINQ